MDIKLSKKYGLNPTILHCVCCGKDYGIGLLGSSYKDPETKKEKEAPMDMFSGLCDECQSVVDQKGMLIIEVRDGEKGPVPYRTGRLVGITKEAKEKMFKGIDSPIAYMERKQFSPLFGEFCQEEKTG